MRGRRYLVLMGLLLVGGLLWQFGVHDGPNLNPFDDPIVTEESRSACSGRVGQTESRRGFLAWIRGAPPAPRPERRAAYVERQVMVRAGPGESLESVAESHGAQLVREPRHSSLGVLSVPSYLGREDFLNVLHADPRVSYAGSMGLIYGASEPETSYTVYQWHLESVQPLEVPPVTDHLVVAVLDTGVAYENYGEYVQAPSLASTLFVAPWDFVNDDYHHNDDHQHGTHIASVISSDGAVLGVAPRTSIMPVKVLGADNSGIELDLIDAIWHSVDNNADVINMSLSFGPGYVLSPGLDEALQAAWDAGILLIAAAGNAGGEFVSYPAAHVNVLAVGATTAKDDDANVGHLLATDYANRNPGVDFVAPGGDVTADRNEDGVPDGILGETIALNDPATISYVLYAGTSQAAAVASGAAVQLLAAGATHEDAYGALHLGAASLGSEFIDGYGQGKLRIKEADKKFDDGKTGTLPSYYVAIMPYLKEAGSDIEAKFELTAMNELGELVSGVEFYATISGTTSDIVKCKTDGGGRCELKAPKVKYLDDDGLPREAAWAVNVTTGKKDNIGVHPRTAFFAPDALEIMLAAMAQEPELEDSLLAFHWPYGKDPDFDDMWESYFLVDTGSGLGGTPLGVIFTPRMIGTGSEVAYDVDLDGTGLGGTPLGSVIIRRFDIEGTGLGGTPLGNRLLTLKSFDGTGLGGTPLGFRPPQMFTGSGQTFDAPDVSLDGSAVLLGETAWCAADLTDTSLGASLDGADWFTAEGYAGATAFTATGLVDTEAVAMTGSGAGTADLTLP
jgi:serine protease